MATCQICGREIKANTGVIAHHGYERPAGWGQQTSSCFGARYKPYEESCDRIPAAIESIELFITTQTKALERLNSDPPENLPFKRGGYFSSKLEHVEKPVDFDPSSNRDVNRPFTYACEYWHRVKDLESAIRSSKIDLEFLKKRLANWKEPEKVEL